MGQKSIAAALFCLVAVSGFSQGHFVFIQNHSFEAETIPYGNPTGVEVTGWVTEPHQFVVTNVPGLPLIPDGNNAAGLEGGPGLVNYHQIVGEVLQNGFDYRLTVSVWGTGTLAVRVSSGPFFGYESRTVATSTGPSFQDYSVSLLASDITEKGLAGSNFEVRLGDPNDLHGRIYFDNVRLEAISVVPEPTAGILVASGFGLLSARSRRKTVYS